MKENIKGTSILDRKGAGKEFFCVVVILTINMLFSIKYISRYTDYYPLIISFLLCFHVVLFCMGERVLRVMQERTLLISSVLSLFCFALVCLFVWNKVPVNSLNVDRWSVITSFWDSYFDGRYVYYALSHLGNHPGPMPFYFIIALPFYFIGELGFLSLAGVFLLFLLLKLARVGTSAFLLVILLLVMTSPFYLWEVLVRSNIFLNSVLVLGSLVVFLKAKNYNTLKSQFMIGIIIGLLLSTRNVFALCYIILFSYSIRVGKISISSIFKIGIIAASTFVATFLPFLIGFFDNFVLLNPFIIQSSFLMPFGWVLIAVFFTCFMFFFCEEDADLFFYCGVALFVTILLYTIYHVLDSSVYTSLIKESSIDVSYLILCIPFFLYYIVLKASDGKNSGSTVV